MSDLQRPVYYRRPAPSVPAPPVPVEDVLDEDDLDSPDWLDPVRSVFFVAAWILVAILAVVAAILLHHTMATIGAYAPRLPDPAELVSDSPQTYVFSSADIGHGTTITDFSRNVRSEEYEYLAAFTTDGRKLFECTSTDQIRVIVPSQLQTLYHNYGGSTIIHNHPLEGDTAFSIADLVIAASMDVKTMVVVSPDYTYTIGPSDLGWPTTTTIESWFAEMESAHLTDDRYWRAVTIHDAAEHNSYAATCTTHYLVKIFAEQFGLSYQRDDAPATYRSHIMAPN